MLLLLLSSTASHTTEVCPILNSLSDRGSQVTFGSTPELSATDGLFQVTTAVGSPVLVSKDLLSGQDNVGASISVEIIQDDS